MPERKINDFIARYGLSAMGYDLQEEIEKFRREMVRGLSGEDSSLYMIPTFLSPEAGACPDETVIVLDAGGTNLRVGAVLFRDGVAAQVDFEKYPLPGTDRELTAEAFFDAIAEKLAPYLDRGSKVGFCFSYAAQCMEDRDARLVRFCKEVKVTGAEGLEICKALDAAIRRRGVTKQYAYVQLNDTVATQLGGMAASDRSAYDGYIGFILGTGTNGCYTENTASIRKYTGTQYREKTMIVNMESGCYAGFRKGELDEIIDNASALPGDHQAEKMISGAYLGKIIMEALKRAQTEGVITSFAHDGSDEVPMPHVNDFLAGRSSMLDCLSLEDKEAVTQIILALYGRTARLMTVVFTSIALQKNAGREKPMAIVLEGSTYQKSPRLQDLLQKELEAVERQYGIRFAILGAENATLTGSAFAAISNL